MKSLLFVSDGKSDAGIFLEVVSLSAEAMTEAFEDEGIIEELYLRKESNDRAPIIRGRNAIPSAEGLSSCFRQLASIHHTFLSGALISNCCRGRTSQRRRMILPNKNPYSFGNSWRGTVVQADLIEWEEWLRLLRRN